MNWLAGALAATLALLSAGCSMNLQRGEYELTGGGRIIHFDAETTKIFAPAIREKLLAALSKSIRRRPGLKEGERIYADALLTLEITKYQSDLTNEGKLLQRILIGVDVKIQQIRGKLVERSTKNYQHQLTQEATGGFIDNPERDKLANNIINSLAERIISDISSFKRQAAE